MSNHPLYLIGSPSIEELQYISNELILTTITYEYKTQWCQNLREHRQSLTTLREFDYEFSVPSREELKKLKNIFFTPESKSRLKVLSWCYFLCHYNIKCQIIGDNESFQSLHHFCKISKNVLKLKYDEIRRDLCCISLNR